MPKLRLMQMKWSRTCTRKVDKLPSGHQSLPSLVDIGGMKYSELGHTSQINILPSFRCYQMVINQIQKQTYNTYSN